MNFFDLNDDVKSIITKHLTSDYFTRTMFMSKHHMMMSKMKIILTMVKYIRSIKISMVYYKLVPHVFHLKNTCLIFKKKNQDVIGLMIIFTI